jgi:predicted nucleic acid-binding protein
MSRTRHALAAFMALGALACACATAADPEYIYGAELMTPQERERYRRDLRDAPSPAAESKVRERHRAQIRERARKRGVDLVEPGGTVGPKRQ